ncbi:putative dihydroxyacetone kinase protein [Neofusicoccum parvum]|nr:putative dihydroxyacetone kinase protein [Neofusicoccum parvum]
MPDKKVKFAETHMGPTGEASEPANHRPTAQSLGEFQDVLAGAYEEFKKMEVRNEEELARDLPSDVNKSALKDMVREASRLGAQRTGMALMEMLMAEFKSAVEGEVAS